MATTTFTRSAKLSIKAEKMFQQAIAAFNKGHKYHALQTARYAMQVARKNAPHLKSDICGFLAWIKYDLGQAGMASFYCHQALVYLDKNTASYGADRKYLLTLQSQINRLN